MSSVAACFNVHAEQYALPGALENASQWADHIHVAVCTPGGGPTDDATMDILRAWGITPVFIDIMQGFGVIRTRIVRECGCDWGIIMDADERIMVNGKVLRCHGNDQFPGTLNPQNSVEVIDQSFCHWRWLKGVIDGAGDDYDAVRTCRRAWMDIAMKRPAQNWAKHADWQCRILRNAEYIGYDPHVKIHERIVDFRTGAGPKMFQIDDPDRNLYHEHHSNFFKPMEKTQNEEDIRIYNSLEDGVADRMWITKQPK
jgi:hypothetical protein